ncbi:MAG TPA: DUF4032 domain-containing protein [Jiangellales bacterium]|nr:DUF4032 domain-containing protein [Jiangellales bacterium]
MVGADPGRHRTGRGGRRQQTAATYKGGQPGHHRRLLFTRTGIEAQENRARRLINDVNSYRSYLERTTKRPLPIGGREQLIIEGYDGVVT